MKKLLSLIFCCFLSACGGGNSSKHTVVEPVKPVVNAAPQLSGSLSVTMTAQQTKTLTLAISDAENDTVTVSFKPQPSWLKSSLQQNQLVLTLQPELADVQQHQLVLLLSDGKNVQEFPFNVTVLAKPVNQAPQLSGALSIEMLVGDSKSLTYALTDAEKDAISASIKDKPDWVNMTLQGQQLTLALNPTAAQAGNHTLVLQLTDGQQQQDYTLQVQVNAKVANKAPVLSGPLSFEIAAAEKKTISYSLSDAENDALTFTFSDKPNWVVATLQNNQLLLTFNPSFTDIREHNFTLTLSDGQNQRQYPLQLTVVDNPKRWVVDSTVAADFIGYWVFNDKELMLINQDNTGFYLDSVGRYHLISWSSIKNGLSLRLTEQLCAEECVENVQLYSIAGAGNQRRLVLDTDVQAQSYPAVRQTQQLLADGRYHDLDATQNDVLTKTATSIELAFPFTIDSRYRITSYLLSGSIPITSGAAEKPQFKLPLVLRTTQHGFYNLVTRQFENLNFELSLTKLELLASPAKYPVFSYQITARLLSEVNQVSDYDSLDTFLKTVKTGQLLLQQVVEKPVPEFVLNQRYPVGAAISSDVTANFRNMLPEIVFTDASHGVAYYQQAHSGIPLEQAFNWRVAQNKLIITVGDKSAEFSFVETLRNGLSLLNEQTKQINPFVVDVVESSSKDFIGAWVDEFSTPDNMTYLNFIPNFSVINSNEVYTEANSLVTTGYWKPETDGSVTSLQVRACSKTSDFATCENDLKQKIDSNQATALVYSNYKIISKKNNKWLIKVSTSSRSKPGNFSSNQYLMQVNPIGK